ncbi:nucleotidyltransferase domain-containing protein [Clostridium vincentii]|uniref:Nucleotidyltransferase domain protein n=1 Tax=Clostridium vincentii TaxID=52704 RepID=A0A2T0BD05_9CLOT|nr:nucleotidyltransferase domain-containing protein [Clostridium vincentii]PRR81779.1 Nucleotidyltransferase domain protein [Clostridium vincentii]
MYKEELKKNLESMDDKIISVIQFGSYGTCDWVKDRSDIDVAIVVQPKITFEDTLNMEDNLEDLLKEC